MYVYIYVCVHGTQGEIEGIFFELMLQPGKSFVIDDDENERNETGH